MLSLIDVTCPHCGIEGQVALPPMGAIILGPCPHCREFVAVFCGRVLPLEKDILMNRPVEERRRHLVDVLTNFLNEQVSHLDIEVDDHDIEPLPVSEDDVEPEDEFTLTTPDRPISMGSETFIPKDRVIDISDEEMAQFVNVNLRLLDNEEYFKAVFG